MSLIDSVNTRYANSAFIEQSGVELVAVADQDGSRFNAAARRLLQLAGAGSTAQLDDLLGIARALRWKRATHPAPAEFAPDVDDIVAQLEKHVVKLRGALRQQEILDELLESSRLLAQSDSPVGNLLLQSVQEIGPSECVVVAASRQAAMGASAWLRDHGVKVFTAGELELVGASWCQGYVVGPPRFFRSALVTAPLTEELSYLFPAWFADRSVPRSALSQYAEGAIRPRARLFVEGVRDELAIQNAPDVTEEDLLLPQPNWGEVQITAHRPTDDEVEARKVLLSGGQAMWLDDGDRIRTLNPHQPPGERITYTSVQTVQVGTYLLLRQGETERNALYSAAVSSIENRADVEASQADWKTSLAAKIDELGIDRVARRLRDVGVRAADRAKAWTDPYLIRPSRDSDFRLLLSWLGISISPTFDNASALRRSLYLVSNDIGRQLEAAISAADIRTLDSEGRLSLDVHAEGFRGILATRVLAISPFSQIVSRSEVRKPFEDRSGLWLE